MNLDYCSQPEGTSGPPGPVGAEDFGEESEDHRNVELLAWVESDCGIVQ